MNGRLFLRRSLIWLTCLLLLLPLLGAQEPAAAKAGKSTADSSIVVFMTDFGILDDSVALCKGVMLTIAPDLRIVDLTHQVTPYSIADGARFLAGTTPYYPKGTVFVVVVDPGVGSARKAIVARSKRGQYFVLPDNGLLTYVQDNEGIDAAREITNRSWLIESAVSSTFHGRDIFSPVGAHLAKGENFEEVGPALDPNALVRLAGTPAKLDQTQLTGHVIALDGPFGSLITNVRRETFSQLGYQKGDTLTVHFPDRDVKVPFVKTFSDVPLNTPLAYIDSRGRLGFAVNQGNFSKVYSEAPPAEFSIARKR